MVPDDASMASSGTMAFASELPPPAEASAAASFLSYSAAIIRSQSSLRTNPSGARSASSSGSVGTV
eukprot:2920972-Alexandrium_andersonii.AAC.1